MDECPLVVKEKSRVDDWEVDTIIGRYHHQRIVTIIDRCSKFNLMKKVLSEYAKPVKQAIVDLIKPIKEHTLTNYQR